eukprot:TRINITY_DN22517_c0_g1_i1.p1 TRINITY_DN22517_c0_g1~~TRINITY_DN22517_c0_g1_i1.p1  ORF type:complete len:641 (+),score=191.22 TRINITY_DN22517_c0_g1_i1:63-1985(+)
MAEIEELIFAQLNGLGIEVGDIRAIRDFDSSLLYRSAHRFCVEISKDVLKDSPKTLPAGMSSRFKATSELASAINSLGYPEELTFNQFMYPNPSTTRGVISWLCQNLPTKGEEAEARTDTDALGGGEASELAIRCWEYLEDKATTFDRTLTDLRAASKTIWPPLRGDYQPPVKAVNQMPSGMCLFTTPTSDEEAEWCTQNVDYAVKQIRRKLKLFASLLSVNGAAAARDKLESDEWEKSGKGQGLSRKEFRRERREAIARMLEEISEKEAAAKAAEFRRRQELRAANSSTKSRFVTEMQFGTVNELEEQAALAEAESQHEQKKLEKAEESQRIRRKIKEATKSIQQLMQDTVAAQEEMDRLLTLQETESARVVEISEDGDVLEQKYDLYQRCLQLCDEENSQDTVVAQIEEALETHADLESQWEARQKKLRDRYNAIEAEIEKATSKSRLLMELVEEAKQRSKQLKIDSKKKDEFLRQLEAEVEKCPKGVDREHYLQRITDIIRNIRKQQDQVVNISNQTRDTMKEIGTMREHLVRAFAETEEVCFQEVKEDSQEAAKNVYKGLISLRENFDKLIEGVEQKGSLNQQTYEIEEKLEKQQSRNESIDTEQITTDVANIQQENDALAGELKQLRSKLKSLLE